MSDGNCPDEQSPRRQNGRAKAASECAQPTSNSAAETPSAPTDPAAQEVEWKGVQFDALRNAIYHTARGHHYAACHRWLMFGVIATGTAGVANLFEGITGPKWFAAATAILAVLDLVMDLKGKASQHERLKQEYYNLLAIIETTSQPDPAKVRRWRGKIIRLTAQESKTYKGVDAIAYNDAADALGYKPVDRLRIPFLVGAFASVCPFGGYSFGAAAEQTLG